MTYTVRRLEDGQAALWNDFVERANDGTVFHRLDFLAYHGDRFRGCEHPLVFYKGQALAAVLPLAVLDEGGRRVARSPYGASYGGPVTREPLRFRQSHELIDAWLAYLREQQVDELFLRLPIACYCGEWSQTFRIALEQRGCVPSERSVCSVTRLDPGRPLDEIITARARTACRKAERLGVRVVFHADLEHFWRVMELTFAKHGAAPTHSFEEYAWLNRRFPDRVYANVAWLDDRPVAGIGCMRVNQRVLLAFYLCTDPQRRDSQATSLLIDRTMRQAHEDGIGWFDFGTTGRHDGFVFKESFGTVGQMREGYRGRVADLVAGPCDALFGRAA